MAKYKSYDIDFKIADKVAIITGGRQGLGNAIAKLYHAKGAKPILFDIDPAVEDAARSIGENALGVAMDVTDTNQINAAVDKVAADYGAIDILCNVAGIGQLDPAEEITEDVWDRVMKVNLKGSFFMAQAVGKRMIESGAGGKIINMASQAAVIGLWGHACYGATKAGIVNMTKVLACEWGKYDINVNSISPTVVSGPMTEEFWSGERRRDFLGKVPMGRFAEPDEIAACALFLASSASDMITGENLVIDGGYSAI